VRKDFTMIYPVERFLSFLVDTLIISGVILLLLWARQQDQKRGNVVFSMQNRPKVDKFFVGTKTNSPIDLKLNDNFDYLIYSEGKNIERASVAAIDFKDSQMEFFLLLVPMMYYILLLYFRHQTVGQAFFRLRVVDSYGGDLSLGELFSRVFLYLLLSRIPFGLFMAALSTLFTCKHVTIYDYLTGTFVVKVL
jgi:uncharacterized RDD family membrane protein YckC